MSELLSSRARAIRPSATMALAARAAALKAAGRAVLSLTAGEPDMDTPGPIVEAAHAAMKKGRTHYTGVGGLPELGRALAAALTEDGVPAVDPDCVVATPGAKQAVFYAVQALVDPRDVVLIPEPAWVSYREIVGLAGGRVVSVPLDPDQNWRLDPDRLLAAGRDAGGAKLLVLNSPSNPTGRVLTEEEIVGVARVAHELDLLVLSDEIYGRLVYAPHRFRRLASVQGLAGRVITVDGFSKAYAMTGWRLGWLAGPPEVAAAVRRLQGHTATCPAEFTQLAGVVALEQCDAAVEGFRETFERRNRLVVEHFGSLPGLRVKPAEGAFYAFLDARGLEGGDDVALCERFLDEAEVAMVPGSSFGEAGRGFLRMSFATDDASLIEAAARLKGVLAP